MISYLLLSKDPRIIRLSSINDTTSDVSAPFNRSSPRFLNGAKDNSCVFHSDTTAFNFASMSLSFTAEIQISCNEKKFNENGTINNLHLTHNLLFLLWKTS